MISHSESPNWQQRVLAMAQMPQCFPVDEPVSDADVLLDAKMQQSIRVCEGITAQYSKSFYTASGLLPREKRRVMRVLYAFCRVVDNLADDNIAEPLVRLQAIRRGVLGQAKNDEDPVLFAWSAVREVYRIPICFVEQLLDGIERDLVQKRYPTFEDLAVYCYGVASTVGLMSMHITEFLSHQAVPYAIKLGVALQLTNIMRDVGEDWRSGRLYFPQDELAGFQLDERDIAAARVDDRWRAFMRFQIDRARQLYVEALPGVALLHPDGRLAVAAAAFLYRGILDDIEVHDYDVFTRRAYVTRSRKIRLLLQASMFARSTRTPVLTHSETASSGPKGGF